MKTNKSEQFSISSVNIQSISSKFDQLRIILDGLELVYRRSTWLSQASDIFLLSLNNYNLFSQGKICSWRVNIFNGKI